MTLRPYNRSVCTKPPWSKKAHTSSGVAKPATTSAVEGSWQILARQPSPADTPLAPLWPKVKTMSLTRLSGLSGRMRCRSGTWPPPPRSRRWCRVARAASPGPVRPPSESHSLSPGPPHGLHRHCRSRAAVPAGGAGPRGLLSRSVSPSLTDHFGGTEKRGKRDTVLLRCHNRHRGDHPNQTPWVHLSHPARSAVAHPAGSKQTIIQPYIGRIVKGKKSTSCRYFNSTDQ